MIRWLSSYYQDGYHLIWSTAIWQALQEHDGKNWETEEELLPSGHQAPKLKLGLITFTFTWLNLMYCVHTVQPCLHILLAVCTFFLLFAQSSAHPCLYYYLLSPQYTVLHILFHCTFYPLFFSYSYLYLYIFSCVMFQFYFLHCPLSWFTFHYRLPPVHLSMWRIK